MRVSWCSKQLNGSSLNRHTANLPAVFFPLLANTYGRVILIAAAIIGFAHFGIN